MEEKPEAPPAPKLEKVERVEGEKTDLAAAVRRARLENAERAATIADLRDIEVGRLGLLESELKPVVRQAPPGVDMFDLALSRGEHPRLFLDMVAFVEMGRDRRAYRFLQDTRHGRVLIAESHQIDPIVDAVTDYVARRLVERERILAAESACAQAREPNAAPGRSSGALRGGAPHAPAPGVSHMGERLSPSPSSAATSRGEAEARSVAFAPRAPPRRRPGLASALGAALRFVIMTLGSITLAGLLALAGYLAWTLWLPTALARWISVFAF